MPLANGQPTLEDAVTILEGKPSPAEVAKSMDTWTAAARDIRNRLQAIEHAHLEEMHKIARLEERVTAFEGRLISVETDRDVYKQRVDTLEKTPIDNAKRLDDYEKRLRTVEGAVGSASVKPLDPIKAPGASASADAPKPGFFSPATPPVSAPLVHPPT